MAIQAKNPIITIFISSFHHYSTSFSFQRPSGVSSISASINFITIISNMRGPGTTMHRSPLFVWSVLVTAHSHFYNHFRYWRGQLPWRSVRTLHSLERGLEGVKEKRKSSRWGEVSLLLVAPSRSDPASGVLVSAAYRRRARREADEEIN